MNKEEIHVFAGRAVKRERRKGSSRRQQTAYGAAVKKVARELLSSVRSKWRPKVHQARRDDRFSSRFMSLQLTAAIVVELLILFTIVLQAYLLELVHPGAPVPPGIPWLRCSFDLVVHRPHRNQPFSLVLRRPLRLATSQPRSWVGACMILVQSQQDCYIKLTLLSRAHGGTRKCRATKGACGKGGSPNRRKFVHKGRTSTMSATVRGALARGTDLSTAPCYIKLTLLSRAHGGTRKCRATKWETREERRMNMYKSMRICAMHNVLYNEEAVHTKDQHQKAREETTGSGRMRSRRSGLQAFAVFRDNRPKEVRLPDQLQDTSKDESLCCLVIVTSFLEIVAPLSRRPRGSTCTGN